MKKFIGIGEQTTIETEPRPRDIKSEKDIIYKLSLNVGEMELLKSIFSQIMYDGGHGYNILKAEELYQKMILEFAAQEA